MSDLVINCSRIGKTGGLRSFSESVMSVLANAADPPRAVVPGAIPVPAGVTKISIPGYLGSTSSYSRLRPIAWLIYGRFFFPVSRDSRVLCTTHHVLPAHKHQIVTVHDLRPYFYPDTPLQKHYFQTMLPKALQRCDGILTVSETSRQLIAETYRISESRIRVVPNTVSPGLASFPSQASLTRSEARSREYLLVVGASMSHKNVEELLLMHRHWTSRYDLIIVASGGSSYERGLRDLTTSLGITDSVEFLGSIDNSRLQELYANCSALVFPSKMEGFGLPPLEAIAHGRPVIVSDIPLFREIYGQHAIYVELGSEESWERAINDIDDHTPQKAQQARTLLEKYSPDQMSTALRAALTYFWG